MSEVRMVVGLGNPGSKYVGTRHNIGFEVINCLAEALGIKVNKKKFGAIFGWGEYSDKKLILLKPWQFVNCSGQAAATAAGFYKVELSHLLVVTDDMALEPGRIRIRAKGSSGGHNGLADIIEKVKSEQVNRLRVGIGECGDWQAYDYVLSRPNEEERMLLDEALVKAREAVLCWIERGVEAAMNEYNG